MKYSVVTNESFEMYIDYLSRRRGRGKRFEDRFDSLDLDDITADVNVPSEVEVDDAVRELDLFDDVAVKTGASDVKVDVDGQLRLLDLDPIGSPVHKHKEDDKFRDLDFDETGKKVSKSKSNIGNAIGSLDYDDDIDTSNIAATIDDVYTALASEDTRIVKAMIKRYAGDITDNKKITEVLLAHAIKLNYESLRAMCGDMKITLTSKEKELGFIDRADIKDALVRFKSCAATLTGENNTYGLIPNAIVSCSPEDQTKCINVIDFLITWCELPLIPIYFRGAVTRHLYDVADFLLDEMPDLKFNEEFLTGRRGLLTRVKNYDDVPKKLIERIAERIDTKKLSSSIIGDFVIMCLSNNNNKAAKKVFDACSENKKEMIIGYVDDNDVSAYQKLVKMLKL